ncbi:hypothetical protein ACI5KX_01965 [Erythrobacter sp. GH1-10]|uniref:hypothetical protein n=1 Tax=Erythrobacter sp. GH1-10 TaxID=3349334 RepID=UPI0038779B26
MIKPNHSFSLTSGLIACGAVLCVAAPAAAQDKAGDKVNMVIAYDESECPETAAENEIVICEILVEAERYRIPRNLRQSDSPQNTAWTERVETIRYIGEFGAMSCSPAGAGGFTGCTQKMIDAAYADRAESENVRFGQLIEQARQERLSTIDTDAAAEQERVEQIEREYLERLERERDAPLPGEIEQTPAAPAIGPTDDEPEPEG